MFVVVVVVLFRLVNNIIKSFINIQTVQISIRRIILHFLTIWTMLKGWIGILIIFGIYSSHLFRAVTHPILYSVLCGYYNSFDRCSISAFPYIMFWLHCTKTIYFLDRKGPSSIQNQIYWDQNLRDSIFFFLTWGATSHSINHTNPKYIMNRLCTTHTNIN